MNPDGTDQLALTKLYSGVSSPSWSPDGNHIIFSSQRVGQSEWVPNIINSDGTNLIQVKYDMQQYDSRFKFSPDGTKISFDSCCFNLSIMNLDGSEVVKISSQFGWDFDWKP